MPNTYLFAPGNRPDRFAKALASGADRIILDLEDAVSAEEKSTARNAIAQWLASLQPDALAVFVVRINDALSEWHEHDLQWLKTVPVQTVMLSKCESPQQVRRVLGHMGPGSTVLPLIETVRGVHAVLSIAQTAGVSRLAFGSLDYMLDLDLPGTGFALDTAATAVSMASRAAELPSPIAGVTPDLDHNGLLADIQRARALGYGAKMCIHPSQLAAVRDALMPGRQELGWAQRVMDAWQAPNNTGAIRVDGQMVDKPVVLRAQRILARASISH